MTKKPTEEFTFGDIYNSYCWLVAHIDPYYGIPATREPPPECCKVAMKEIQSQPQEDNTLLSPITSYRKGYKRFDKLRLDYVMDKALEIMKRREAYTWLLTLSGAEWSKNVSASLVYEIEGFREGDVVFKPFPNPSIEYEINIFIRHLDEILLWHTNKEIPTFYLSNGGEINSLASIKRLWEELKLQPFSPMLSEIEPPHLHSEDFAIEFLGHGDKCAREIKAHFLKEHNKSIETLKQAGNREGGNDAERQDENIFVDEYDTFWQGNNSVQIEPRDKSLVDYMIKKDSQNGIRIEEILEEVYKKEITKNPSIYFKANKKPPVDWKNNRGVFDEAKSRVNKAFKEKFGISELIQNIGKKLFKLSVKIKSIKRENLAENLVVLKNNQTEAS